MARVTQPGGNNIPNGFSASVSIAATTALISGYVFTRNSAGQWTSVGNIPTAVELDDDDVTMLGLPSPFRYATLSRRTSTTTWPWPVRAELATSDTGQINRMDTDNTIGNDQAIQADITPRAFNGADRWFGLVTRYSDINNYYYVTARSTGSVQLKRMRAGAFTTLGSAALPISIGTTYRIRLESVADHVRVFINDRPVIRVRDASLSGGRPGLMTYRTRADFDNVVVNPNPGYVAFTDDFEGFSFDWTAVAGDWSLLTSNGAGIRRNSDVTGGARLLITGAGHDSFGTQGDQIVQADLRPTRFSGADRWVGLIARYRDESNYHYVTLRSSGRLDIRKLVNGSIHTLASGPFTVRTNVTYRVRLEAIGTRLRVYVNGTLRAETTDASLTRAMSSAGVATYKAAVDLDNVWVTQP